MRLLAMEMPSCPLKVCSSFRLAHQAYGRLKNIGQYAELFVLINDRKFYTISFFGFTDACRQIRTFPFLIGKIYRTAQSGKTPAESEPKFFCGLLRRKGLVQVARSLVEQGQVTVLPGQVLSLLGNLSF